MRLMGFFEWYFNDLSCHDARGTAGYLWNIFGGICFPLFVIPALVGYVKDIQAHNVEGLTSCPNADATWYADNCGFFDK